MRSTLKAVDILYQILKLTSSITSAISGKVYKDRRPDNSDKEDIVVNSLPINFEQVQQAVLNVNIHVPNLKLNINGVQDNSQPDRVRLDTITDLVMTAVKDHVGSDYWFFIQQQNVFPSENFMEHYSNIRIDFYSENI